jgi:hypothetical protein
MTDGASWRDLPVGARVVVRRRLSAAEADGAATEGRGTVWTDVIAVVLDVDDDGLTLRTDAPRETTPRELRVAGSTIETAKRIPPRPQRRAARAGTAAPSGEAREP